MAKSGRITSLLQKMKVMTSVELLDRFRGLLQAQAIREYMAAKEDLALTIEVKLMTDEVLRRMSRGNPYKIREIKETVTES